MCEGALIAFVMTRQLEEAGQKVAFLGMMDAWPEENTRRRLVNFVSKYYSKVKDFMAMTPPNREKYLKQTIARIGLRLRPKRARAQVSEATNEVARRAAFEATTQALWDERVFPGPGFVPPKVDVPITVFRVKEQPPWRIKDERLGWSDRTRGGVDLHHVDGVHTDFMRPPHVAVLARELNGVLRKVHAQLERDDALAAAAAPAPPGKAPSR
jgi:thioesterase domain-containing protein